MFQNKNNRTTIGLILIVISVLTVSFVFRTKNSDSVITKHHIAFNPEFRKTSVANQQGNTGKSLIQNRKMISSHQKSGISTLIPIHPMSLTQPGKLTAYLATRQTGVIGEYDDKQLDNPADNIFTIRMEDQLTQNDRVWLSYKLTGLDDYSNVACSVNDRLSFGGYLAKKDSATNRQRVQLNAAWLQKGDNRIQFGLPENAGYGYKVSDLAIEVERGANEFPLAVNAGHSLYNGKAYIHGFVQESTAGNATVKIDGKPVNVRDGEFETVVSTDKQQVEVTALINGKLYSKEICFKRNAQPDKEYALDESIQKTTKTFEKGIASVLQTENAQLKVDNKALLATQQLSVTSLRNMDLPALDMGMNNVTDGRKGFRFLPHGEHFTEGATVALKYDRTKIPDGYTENDIKTYYFDTNTNHWVALERDTVDKTLCMVVSKTTHFTDMINGVIKTPESPETQGFAPTMMSRIKAADPTAKIELIAPPTANNSGSANLSYSLEMPPTRNGMSPNLAIQYNSDGGSGWLGEGWDLNVPSITVDTKFGVPTFDKDSFETETYSLNGIQLARAFITGSGNEDDLDENMFLPDRGVEYLRNKPINDTGFPGGVNPNNQYQFYPRIESNFPFVMRYGTNIDNYKWQVGDKNGAKYYYGYEYAQGEQAVLAGDSIVYKTITGKDYYKTQIGEWKLQSMVDIHGDSLAYTYNKVLEEGYGTALSPKAIYLSKIESFVKQSNTYIKQSEVSFVSKSLKSKKINNARYGFLVSNQRLLDSVVIKYSNSIGKMELVRAYAFNYIDGKFNTNLLSSISQIDSTGTGIVATHNLSYYDKVKDAGGYFTSSNPSPSIDNISVPLGPFGISPIIKTVSQLTQKGILNNTNTTGLGGTLYLGFGLGVKVWSKEKSIGVNASALKTTTTGDLTMIDIDGDGKLESVYSRDKKLYYTKYSTTGNLTYELYGAPSAYLKTKNTNIAIGLAANQIYGLSARIDWDLLNITETSAYFMDVNGDGLVDIVSDEKVYFNYLIDGIPHFDQNSKYSAIPMTNKTIYNKTPAAAGLTTYDKTKDQQIESESSPLQDLVRVWKAPYNGQIKIRGSLKLLPPNGIYDTDSYNNADGVRVAIQKGRYELWSTKLKKTDNNTVNINLSDPLDVVAGENIYFRVQSGDSLLSNGDFDKVVFSPVVEYISNSDGVNAALDENGYSNMIYYSYEGDIVNKTGYNEIDTGVPAVVEGQFIKPITRGDITLHIYSANYPSEYLPDTLDANNKQIYNSKYKTTLVQDFIYKANQNYNVSFSKNLPSNTDNFFWFELSSTFTESWEKIKCKPNIKTSYVRNNITYRDTTYAGVKYNRYITHANYYEESLPKSITIPNSTSGYYTNSSFRVVILNNLTAINKNVRLVVYETATRKVLLDRSINISSSLNPTNIMLSDVTTKGVTCSAELCFDNTSDNNTYGIQVTDYDGNVLSQCLPDVYCKQEDTNYGPMWRNWGQFEYNAARQRYARSLDVDSLVILRDSDNLLFNDMHLIPLDPNFATKRYWQGYSNNISLKGDTMCVGRLINNNLVDLKAFVNPNGPYRVKTADPFEKYYITAPVLTSKQTNISFSLGANILDLLNKIPEKVKEKLSIDAGFTASKGTSEKTLDYIDLNGDGFPDYFKQGTILYSNSRGTMSNINNKNISRSRFLENQPVEKTSTIAGSVSLGIGGGTSMLIKKTATTNSVLKAIEEGTSLNASTSITTSSTSQKISYQDINADGLPDLIDHDNNTVRINYGYRFSDPVSLSLYDKGVKSLAVNAGLGVGAELCGGSIMAGVGIGTASSSSNSRMIDMNNDGLLDLVYRKDTWSTINNSLFNAIPRNELWVRFNNGKDIDPESKAVKLATAGALDFTESVSESANLAGGWGWLIWGLKFVFNINAQISNTNSKLMDDLRDYDGDGLPDIVYTEDLSNTNQLRVQKSTIAYTNKLKSVTNPLGGRIRFGYDRSTCSTEHPGGKWVMSYIVVNDGISDDGDSITTKYEYNNGKHNRREREFDGFGEVITKNMDGAGANAIRQITQTYDNRNTYVKGNLLKSIVTDGSGNKFQEVLNDYYAYNVKTHRIQVSSENIDKYYYYETPVTDLSDSVVVYSPLKSTQTTIYEGNGSGLITNQTLNTYWVNNADRTNYFGDLKTYRYSDKGTLLNDTSKYNYKTSINYVNSKCAWYYNKNKISENLKYFVSGLPCEVKVDDSNGIPYRHIKAFYTQADYPTHLTRISQYLANGDSASTTMKYDRAGNITNKVLPSKMAYTYTYDTRYNMYVTQVKDTFGYVSQLSDYNYKYGIPCRTTDENGNIMLTKLDNLGRVIGITGPNEVAAGKGNTTMTFSYAPKATISGGLITKPGNATTLHYDPANKDNSIMTITLVDGFGRAIQVKKDSYIDGQKKLIVSGRVNYDAMGRAVKTYYPTVSTYGSDDYSFLKTPDTVDPATATYDVLDRPLITTLPDRTMTTMAYAVSEGYQKTTVTDILKNKQESFTNGSGKTVKTNQYLNKDTVLTTMFSYDPVNQLNTVTDAIGMKTISAYDMAGRRTQITHPASGITKFEYDLAGNLTAKQTANLFAAGKKIQYFYTYNRLDSIVYPEHKENNVKYIYGSATDNTSLNRKGRLVYQEDGSGGQEFSYGKQGELTEVRRTLVIPNQATATYVTGWSYDCWNRLRAMTYPDGEIVNYSYNTGGLLSSIAGTKGTEKYKYIDNILYDKFEDKTSVQYGNGMSTTYFRETESRRMKELNVYTKTGNNLYDIEYGYDAVGNITSLDGHDYSASSTYSYDNLYRLKTANGNYSDPNDVNGDRIAQYQLYMKYDNLHNITYKKQDVVQNRIQFNGVLNAGYELSYNYNAGNRQQISNIADANYRVDRGNSTNISLGKQSGDEVTNKVQQYSYDANGNLIYINKGTENNGKLLATNCRKLLWDEENRLLALSDNGYVSNYWYDAAGERTAKMSGDGEGVFVNGVLSGARTGTTNFTAYVSPFTVIGNGGQMSKHIYMGSERIVSKLVIPGTMANPLTTNKANSKDFTAKYADLTAKVKNRYDSLGVTYKGQDNAGAGFYTASNSTARETQQYFYHSDHLGSSTFITDADGNVAQHIEYIPFGEVFVEERNSNWSTPYKFNAKELDEETGLYYYGARYMDPRTSVWISVDPLAEDYPNVSSYVYCHNNPVNMIDPDGCGDFYNQKTGAYIGTDNKNDNLAHTADGMDKDGSFINPVQLSMTHTEFQKTSNVVRQESDSNDPKEDLWIANTTNNNAKASNSSLYKKLMSGFSSADKSALSDKNNTADANSARAAVIDVLTGGADPTGGATFWDGTDFLAWGLKSPNGTPQNKFEEYSSIFIDIATYTKFENAQKDKYKNGIYRYHGVNSKIPAAVFSSPNNWYISTSADSKNWWGFFYYETGQKGRALISTGSIGRSIFWKTK